MVAARPDLFHQNAAEILLHEINSDAEEWFFWLEERTLVHLKDIYGCFTLQRPSKAGEWYLYQNDCQVSIAEVVGKTRELTVERLREAMQSVAVKPHGQTIAPADLLKGQIFTDTPSYALLVAKTLIPDIPTHHISRPRLIEQVNHGVQRKLTLISAPGGYGKTTLLNEWLSNSTMPVSWISLGKEDNDLKSFSKTLLISLEKQKQRSGQSLQQQLSIVQRTPPELLLPVILDILASIEGDFALVLDDYHEIVSLSMQQIIISLLLYGPATMHTLIASRTNPPLSLARLRSIGQLTDIYTEDLRFSSSETQQFFTRSVEMPLSSEALASIYARTEGWATGLYFIALLLQEEKDPERALREISGQHHYVFDYLLEEVFRYQPEHIQQFLLYTSLVPSFNSSLAEELTGRRDCQLLLETLEKANLFLTPLDSTRQHFRYHPFFRDFLSLRLQQSSVVQLPLLYEKIYQWYIRNGQPDAAIEHALRYQLYDQATSLIVQRGRSMLQNNEIHRLSHWIETLPQSVQHTHPVLCLMQTWIALLTRGYGDTAHFWYKKVTLCLDLLKVNPGQRDISADFDALDLEVSILEAHIAVLNGERTQAMSCHRAFSRFSGAEQPFLHAIVLLTSGNEHRMSGRYEDAMSSFKEVYLLGRTLEHTYIEAMAMWQMAHLYMIEGHLHTSAKLYEEAIRLTEKSDPPFPYAGTLSLGLARLAYEQNDLETAQSLAEQGIAASKQGEYGQALLYGYVILASIKQAKHLPKEASNLYSEARFLQQKYRLPVWFEHLMQAHEIRLLLLQGECEKAAAWTPQLQYSEIYELEQLTHARLLILQKSCYEARAILVSLLDFLKKSGKEYYRVECTLLLAQSYQEEQREQALDLLTHALRLAEKEQHIRPFLNEENLIAGVWPKISAQLRLENTVFFSQDVFQEFFQCIRDEQNISHAPVFLASENKVPVPSRVAFVDELSDREIEVLRHLALGLSSREIAQGLVIGESTVKWHIKKIYSKLRVHNRVQVITQARMLKIV